MFTYKSDDNYEKYVAACNEWLCTPELDILVKRFGNEIPLGLPFRDRLNWLAGFSEAWDFRRMQKNTKDNRTGEAARWLIDHSSLKEEQTEASIRAAEKLGMINAVLPSKKSYDAILALGGARMSCLFRMRYAKELCEKYGIRTKEITGLTGTRLISDSERSATDTYAPDAITEFDLMCAAAKSEFGLTQEECRERGILKSVNNSWEKVRYKSEILMTVLAAPSSEPEKRRANTADTFRFWREQRKNDKENTILLVTSQIYVPYQQLEAVRMLGVPYGYNVETVGFPREWSANMPGLQTAANYLQEIRSALLSMQRLIGFENKKSKDYGEGKRDVNGISL